MNLIFRLLIVSIGSFFRSKLDVSDSGRISLRVLPNDLDLNFHMNNGRFLSVMDLGRIDLIIRMGMLKTLSSNGWYPVIGAIHTTFRKSLYLFERYDIVSKIVGWDEKWIYLSQTIERDGEEVATAVMKTLFMSENGKVATDDIARAIGEDGDFAPVPDEVRSLVKGGREHR